MWGCNPCSSPEIPLTMIQKHTAGEKYLLQLTMTIQYDINLYNGSAFQVKEHDAISLLRMLKSF